MIKAREVLEALSRDRLHLTLMPTEACNFRCSYCYEDFTLGRMKKGVVSGIKELLTDRAPELRLLILSWFGGEPLLARDVIEEIMLHSTGLAKESGRLQVQSDMSTNGYRLTLPVFRRLVELGVRRYQITLDGPRDIHDHRRIRIRGRPSFDRIWENLLAMRREPYRFEVHVRMHVDRENHGRLVELFDEYCREFGKDRRFKVFFRLLGRFGGENDGRLPVFGQSEGQHVIENLRGLAAERDVPCYVPRAGTCYAAQGNSFVIRADGRVAKCTLSLEHPRNQVGSIDPEGRLNIDAGAMKGWLRGLFSGNEDEMKCPMLGYADARKLDSAEENLQRIGGS